MGLKRRSEEKVMELDASMHGTLSFKDPVNLRINGKFEGTLDTRGTLTIGETASVLAEIIGETVVIGGRVKGKITAKEKLVLLSTAVVEGDVFPVRIDIAEGAIFDGRCTMLGDFLNVDELARYLEVDTNSIMDWSNSGKIPATRQGDDWRFEKKAIDSWVAAGKVGK